MSGLAKGLKKVVKAPFKVGKKVVDFNLDFAKKIAPIAIPAAAIYFGGPALMSAFGGAGAAGSGLSGLGAGMTGGGKTGGAAGLMGGGGAGSIISGGSGVTSLLGGAGADSIGSLMAGGLSGAPAPGFWSSLGTKLSSGLSNFGSGVLGGLKDSIPTAHGLGQGLGQALIGNAAGTLLGGGGQEMHGPPPPSWYGRGGGGGGGGGGAYGGGGGGGYWGYGGVGAGGDFGGIGGILGRNLAQADARKEYQRLLSSQTGDYLNRLGGAGTEHLRMWDAMFPRRQQAFDQNLGFRQAAFDQYLPQARQLDARSWSNFDQGISRIGALQKALLGGMG